MKKVILIFAMWLVALLAVGYASQSLSPWQGKSCGARMYPPYFRWDSSWYTGIAQRGYTYSEEKNSSIAYFPLFPMVLRTVHPALPLKLPMLGFCLNIVFSFLTLLILYRLVRIDFSDRESIAIVSVWLLFPASYFLVTGYPDALFALLTATSLYFGRKRKWTKAGVAAALLALTKPYGILMMPVLLLEYLWDSGWSLRRVFSKKAWTPLLLPLVAFGAFLVFNVVKFGTPFAFLIAQRTWGRSFGNPFVALTDEARQNLFSGTLLTGSHLPYIVYVASVFFFVVALVLSWQRVRKTQILFSILVLTTAILSGTLTSFGRYMFLSFSVFIGPAVVLAKRRTWLIPYLTGSFIVLLVIASFFVRCYPFE